MQNVSGFWRENKTLSAAGFCCEAMAHSPFSYPLISSAITCASIVPVRKEPSKVIDVCVCIVLYEAAQILVL